MAEEHLATALAQAVMAQELLRGPAPEPNGKKVLLACIHGNLHAVGMQMVADAFTLAGWDVNLLGASVPVEVLVKHAQAWGPDLLGLSASLPEHVRELSKVVEELRGTLGDTCPPILTGGQGFNASQAQIDQDIGVQWVRDAPAAVIAGAQACMLPTTASAPVQTA